MIPPFLMTMAAGLIKDLVADAASNLAKPHIEAALAKAPPELKEALDKAVDEDNSHDKKNIMDWLT